MKKIILALFSIIMIATMLVGTTVFAGAEATDIIPVPEMPAIDRPYKSIGELGIDFEENDAYFPQQIEIRYEGGKAYVEDFGASSVEIYDFGIYNYVSLELIEGYWTAELSAAPTIVYVYSYDASLNDRYLTAVYYGDGSRDHYVRLIDNDIGVEASFAFEYGNVTVIYQSGNYYYEDRYEGGILNTHGVSNHEDKESINQVLYGSDGKIRYCTLYTDGYYHYFPEQGWDDEKYTENEAITSGIEYATIMKTEHSASVEHRIEGALNTIMILFDVPEETRKMKVAKVLAMDYRAIGRKVYEDFKRYVTETNEHNLEEISKNARAKSKK
ncbi:MAG: hypothetical protein E7370_06070 [Clostridiales bacterium]|nr:hypothetical protein [Clostridiales bacterium]